MRLSIVVPVYNVEAWIERCLNSCFKQGLASSDYEIIVVNDGTKDNSIAVVERLRTKISNIVVINQKNAGLSAARNTGIKNAKGQYIWFVDGDDQLEEGYGNKLLSLAEHNDLDVLCFGINLQYPDRRKEPYIIQYEKDNQIYKGTDFICKVGMPPAAWCALYKRDFLKANDLHFYTGILHEDLEFTPRAYALAGRIMYADYHVYNYEQREGSIMKSQDKMAKKNKDLLTVCDSLYKFAQDHLHEFHEAYDCVIEKVNFAFSQSLRNHTESVFNVSDYKSRPYYPLKIGDKTSKKDRIKYRFINFSLPLYLLIYKLTKK